MPAKKKYHTEEERIAACRASYRKYKENNKEKVRQSRKDFEARNKDNPEYKKRRAVYAKRWRLKLSPEERTRREREQKAKTVPERLMLNDARKRAKKKGIEFNISLEDIFIPETCPVLGIPLFRGKGSRSPNSPSLDRVVNAEGYVKGNIAVISQRANALKNDGTAEEFKKLILYMEKFECLGTV